MITTCAHSPALTCAACPPRQAGAHRSPVIQCWGYRCGAPLHKVTGQAGGIRYVNVSDQTPHTCARWPLGGDAPARAPYAARHACPAGRSDGACMPADHSACPDLACEYYRNTR
jgi:hypothetical protein